MHRSAVRGAVLAEASQSSEAGAMVAVQARREVAAAQIAGIAGISIANHNAPEQCVVSGPKTQIEQAAAKLAASGLRTVMLPVSRSEEHTSELQSLMRISYADFCLKKKKDKK